MTRRGDNSLHEHVERDVIDELRRTPTTVPDLTDPIMTRLGFQRSDPSVARRRRIMRFAGRVGVCVVALAACGFGARMIALSPMASDSAAPTIPAAVGNDLQRQQDRISDVIRTLRSLSPLPAADKSVEDSIEMSPQTGTEWDDHGKDATEPTTIHLAIGPVKWT